MNRIRCAKCRDLLHSKTRHDFRVCHCGAVYLDGGDDYIRMGGWPQDIIIVDNEGNEAPLDAAKTEETP